MRTLADIAETCLDYTDLSSGGSALSTATDRQKATICRCITGALQELHGLRPEAFRIRRAIALPAPETISATLTAGSTSATFATTRDLRGCSFRNGDAWNQVAAAAASPGNAIVQPWTGTTGTHALTIYGDATLLGSDLWTVTGDVHLEGFGQLRPCPDRTTYTAYRDELWAMDYGRRPPSLSRPRWRGMPEAWWVESATLAGARNQLYLRFAPVPDRSYSVSFDVGLSPREIVVTDLSNNTISLPVPADFYDSILIPFVLQRWTGSPWFRNAEAQQEIARQYKVAKALLYDTDPQMQSGSEIVVAIR